MSGDQARKGGPRTGITTASLRVNHVVRGEADRSRKEMAMSEETTPRLTDIAVNEKTRSLSHGPSGGLPSGSVTPTGLITVRGRRVR